jgi:hypothetical protein
LFWERKRVVVFGHQGGWDELLLVLLPLALFSGLLWLANRRADAMNAARDEPAADAAGPEDTPPPA